MKRFLLLALLACGPALANERAESEARLAALSDQVIVALGTVLPKVDGMTCQPGEPDRSPANRMFAPNWRGDCVWDADGKTEHTAVTVIMSTSIVDVLKEKIARDQKVWAEKEPDTIFGQFFGAPEAVVMLTARDLKATPSDSIAILAQVPGDGVAVPAPAVFALAEAVTVMDTSDLEALPEVLAHKAAMATHRDLLVRHHTALASVLMAAVEGEPPPELPSAKQLPDYLFFGAQPTVQTHTDKDGVAMLATLTTSSFALDTEAQEGRFTADVADGDVRGAAVYHDRGRVKVYLSENMLTALIDGRAILKLYVPEEVDGTDPVAAMEAVLAGIAVNDFSGF